MAIGQSYGVMEQVAKLCNGGTVTGMDDSLLLERFIRQRDDSAFETLMARHGSMVLRTCKSILKNRDDAEDAFQATFLIFAKKAGTIRRHGALGSWLYQTAHRVATRNDNATSRRRAREKWAGQMAATTSPSGPSTPDEQVQTLHEEIVRLPEKFRAPVVLCSLQGLTHEEAARQLGCPLGTVNSRLAEARKRLQASLTRRGVAPLGVIVSIESLPKSATAAVSATLLRATTKAAVGFAGGRTLAAGTVSTGALSLAESVLGGMFMRKLMFMLASFVVVCSISAVLVRGQVSDRGGPGRTPESERPGLVSSPAEQPDVRQEREPKDPRDHDKSQDDRIAAIERELREIRLSIPHVEAGKWAITDEGEAAKFKPLTDPDLQGPRTFRSRFIPFEKVYRVTPRVLVSLTNAAVGGGDQIVRYDVGAIDVTKDGFVLQVDTSASSTIRYLQVEWVAIGH